MGKPFDLKYDYGNNNFDVRHSVNVSGLYDVPVGSDQRWKLSGIAGAILSNWQVGGIYNARTGIPIDMRITRPDVVYRNNLTGVITNSPVLVGGIPVTTAVINTLGGGASRNVRRPDVIPGVDPFINSGGTLFLNPAAFATPQPGSFGNLGRNALHGPGFSQFDFTLSRRIKIYEQHSFEFRAEFYNLFNRANFANPVASLPNALGTAGNQLQPGKPFSASTQGASTFGVISSTVASGSQVGLGANRQIQFSLRYSF